jgi:N-methylhydantoinase A
MALPLLVVPRESSTFCAGGMLIADFKHDYVRGHRCTIETSTAPTLSEWWRTMREDGMGASLAEGLEPSMVRFVPSLDLRYDGQWYEINVTFDENMIDNVDVAEIEKRFHQRHDLLFGYSTVEIPIELINIRLALIGVTAKPRVPPAAYANDLEGAHRGHRPAWSRAERAKVATPIFDGGAMLGGARLEGPAVIELATTAIVVPESFHVVVDDLGSFVLHSPAIADQVMAALMPRFGRSR